VGGNQLLTIDQIHRIGELCAYHGKWRGMAQNGYRVGRRWIHIGSQSSHSPYWQGIYLYPLLFKEINF